MSHATAVVAAVTARVMIKLVDGLYHRRRARELLDGVVPDPEG